MTPIYTDPKEALARLTQYLPLAARQAALEPPLRDLHEAILRSLASLNSSPDIGGLVSGLGITDVRRGLERLRTADLVVVNEHGEITGAYPITLEKTDHRVSMGGSVLYAMCSVDALAIGPMFQQATRIESKCRICQTPVILTQHGDRVVRETDTADVQVGIRWQDTHGCAARSLCREMVFFCGPEHANEWQRGNERTNAVLSLPDAISLAKAFFLPLLARSS